MNKFVAFLLVCLPLVGFANSDGFFEKPEWKQGELKVYDHWISSVSTRQHTLGSCVIKARRQGVERISELTEEELKELTLAMKELEMALQQHPAFVPNRFNYLQLGNSLHQLHFHMIPRYQTNREFAGLVWEDPEFGHPPIFSDFKPDMEIILKIKQELLNFYPKNSAR